MLGLQVTTNTSKRGVLTRGLVWKSYGYMIGNLDTAV